MTIHDKPDSRYALLGDITPARATALRVGTLHEVCGWHMSHFQYDREVRLVPDDTDVDDRVWLRACGPPRDASVVVTAMVSARKRWGDQ